MGKSIGSKIALAGIGASVSLVCVTLSYFFSFLSLSFMVISAGGIMLPLAKKYYREALIASGVVVLAGFFITNLYIFVFASASGFYVVFTVFLDDLARKIKEKSPEKDKTFPFILVGYVFKALYSLLVFFIAYRLSDVLFIDVDKIALLANMSKASLYVFLNAVFTVCFLVYDLLLLKIYHELCKLMKKVK